MKGSGVLLPGPPIQQRTSPIRKRIFLENTKATPVNQKATVLMKKK
jgi:hypothetical protein